MFSSNFRAISFFNPLKLDLVGEIPRMHSKRANSFLGTGSVQPKQRILRKNDKYIICRGDLELSEYIKRGGKKGGLDGSQVFIVEAINWI